MSILLNRLASELKEETAYPSDSLYSMYVGVREYAVSPLSNNYFSIYSFSRTTDHRTNQNMTDHSTPSLHTLPIELIYRVMDNLDPEGLLLSFRNVCARINSIMDTYVPYQVYFMLIFSRKEGMTNYYKDPSELLDILFDRLYHTKSRFDG